MVKYGDLREKAIANFELLLEHWKLDYKQISPVEYDFLNPTRQDKRHGACRFNIEKCVGADFAGERFIQADFQRVGVGFDRDDFINTGETGATDWGFDIIGLCQRLHGCSSYKEAAKLLRVHLRTIAEQHKLNKADPQAATKRAHKIATENLKKVKKAINTWDICQDITNTVAEKYLHYRQIFLKEAELSLKFHPRIKNAETRKFLPAMLFKVEKAPNDGLVAIHRIYIRPDGKGKADVSNPKMALGSIKGAGIWFGEPDKMLAVIEGPENALAMRSRGVKFAVSTISAVNMPNITIPGYVETVLILGDPDKAGEKAVAKAIVAYKKQGKRINVAWPPKLDTGKQGDWNDYVAQEVQSEMNGKIS